MLIQALAIEVNRPRNGRVCRFKEVFSDDTGAREVAGCQEDEGARTDKASCRNEECCRSATSNAIARDC
jgi:hypothetical protein